MRERGPNEVDESYYCIMSRGDILFRMKFMALKIVLFPVILLFLQHSCTSYAAAGKRSACYSAIYSFGDSLADTGNLLAADAAAGLNLSQLSYGNLLCGETYFGKATGRFSDGRLIVDYIGL